MGTSLNIWVFIKSVKAFHCRFYLLCFIFNAANVAFSSTTLLRTRLKSFLECRYLTNLPVHSHSKVWIQDIPHKFHLFFIVQPPEHQCFTSTDHWIFLFFHILYDYTKEGNILLTHIYLICYRLCQQACPHSLLPVSSWCFISMYLCEHKMLFSQRQINRLVKQHVLSAFYVGCCAGATKQPFVEHSRDACQMNPICMRTWTYSGRRTAAGTMNGSDWCQALWFPERLDGAVEKQVNSLRVYH